jgi:hypothetical protein
MIEIILEDLNNKTPMATNINIYKLWEMFKSGFLIARQQKDNASSNAKKNLPEICFSRSEYLPQKTGIVPTQALRIGQLIKIELNIDNVLTLRDVKKPYPVSYGNANKEKAGDTETRGEERIQVKKIPVDKKYMTIYIPDDLFKTVLRKEPFGNRDANKNIKDFMNKEESNQRVIKTKEEFRKWIEKNKRIGLIKTYKDTSRSAYYKSIGRKNPYITEENYFDY